MVLSGRPRSPIRYPFGSGQAEEIALRLGLKPAIRQVLGDDQLASHAARWRRLGFHVTQTAFRRSSGSDNASRLGVAVFVTKDRKRGDALRQAEALLTVLKASEQSERSSSVDDEAVKAQGRLLGYPACCVEAFVAQYQDFGLGALEAMSAACTATQGALKPRLNCLDLHVFHYLPWLPCSLSCQPSDAYAQRLGAALAVKHPVFVRRIDDALRAHRIVLDESRQLSVRGVWDGSRLMVEAAWPTALDRHPAARESSRPDDGMTRVLDALRHEQQVIIDGPAIVSGDGTLLAQSTSQVALFPFGRTA